MARSVLVATHESNNYSYAVHARIRRYIDALALRSLVCVTSVLIAITVITLANASHRRNTRRRMQSRLRHSNIFFHPSLKFHSKLHSLQLYSIVLMIKTQTSRSKSIAD